MPIDQSLVGREFPPSSPHEVTAGKLREFAAATGATYDAEVAPPTFPITVAFAAMNDFLADVEVDLFRIVHGEQRFAYQRPVRVGDVLTATLTVETLRQIGGNDIIGTTSVVTDADGALVCTTKATLIHRGEES
ncbi:MaoC family dehydratase [Nocardioides sp. JQ2195]|uniref:FAS1-like dehydratase domain-containing protein n=1 Tax=Nocardioides sp. JQ2195 TaxID=2592334 RepID=UPI00143E9513|nr:MaoC family dehydratase N-terminal domain-containing protein [Nocardioides sp. JQ2195]QIX28076.1 MaoC family dehydratase [Nocardioides sp. JQ2195]